MITVFFKFEPSINDFPAVEFPDAVDASSSENFEVLTLHNEDGEIVAEFTWRDVSGWTIAEFEEEEKVEDPQC